MRSVTILSALLLVACGGGSATPPPQEPPPPQERPHDPPPPPRETTTMIGGVYFSATGAPDPLACTTDAECLVDTVPDEGGCCIAPTTGVRPQSWPWHTWMSQRRMSDACRATQCPPLPAPMPPSPNDCRMQGKCNAGHCGDTCAAGPAGS